MKNFDFWLLRSQFSKKLTKSKIIYYIKFTKQHKLVSKRLHKTVAQMSNNQKGQRTATVHSSGFLGGRSRLAMWFRCRPIVLFIFHLTSHSFLWTAIVDPILGWHMASGLGKPFVAKIAQV